MKNFMNILKDYFKSLFNANKKQIVDAAKVVISQKVREIEEKIMQDANLSDNFTLSELLVSQTASRLGLSNTPTPEDYKNLVQLAQKLLQPLRTNLGKAVIVSSGYRSAELNKEIGGAEGSQHQKGEAADITVVGMNNLELAEYIQENLVFDQLILEFYDPKKGPNSGWVHVSFTSGENRGEVLTAMKIDGKTNYFHGIKKEA